MAKVPDIVPITDLLQDAARVLKRVRNLKEPLVITQRGRAAAVMLSYREIVLSPYRFFYRVKGKTVWIVAVWHGSRLSNEPSQ